MRLRVVAVVVATVLASISAPPAGAVSPPERPSPVWEVPISASSSVTNVLDVDRYAGRVYAAGYTDGALHGPEPESLAAVLEVRTDAGRLEEGKQFVVRGQTIAVALDAGPWGVVVVGTADGPVPGPEDSWVRRYRPDGSLAWSTPIDGDDWQSATDVVVQGDEVRVVGSESRDAAPPDTPQSSDAMVWTLGLSDGTPLGTSRIDVDDFDGLDAVALVGGDLVVAGYTMPDPNDAPDLPHVDVHGLVQRLTGPDLTPVWSRTDSSVHGAAALVQRDGVLYVAGGDRVAAVDPADGSELWGHSTAPITTADALADTRAGVVVGGLAESDDSLLSRALVQAWSPVGRRLWNLGIVSARRTVVGVNAVAGRPSGLVIGGLATRKGAAAIKQGYLSLVAVRRPIVRAPASLTVRRGAGADARVVVRNRGEVSEQLAVRGCRGAHGVAVHYRARGRDVTTAVRAGVFRTPRLAPGRSTVVRVLAVATAGAARGPQTCRIVARSTGDAATVSARDAIRVVVRRR